MRAMNQRLALALLVLSGCPSSSPTGGADAGATDMTAPLQLPPWMVSASILAHGDDSVQDCRTQICRHNENTDLTRWNGDVWLVHRTAHSQILGDNSALHVYHSPDNGVTLAETAIIPAVTGRDIRDPHFYTVGKDLWIKCLTRLPVTSERDSNVDTIAMATHSSDGKTWSPLVAIGPPTWSFWRIQQHAGVYYTAAYADGDASVALFTSTDGAAWTQGATIYDVTAMTPLETELTFFPSGTLLALVRTDGDAQQLLGDLATRQTQVCWSQPPYATFDCSQSLVGERLDGPLSFFWQGRLFEVARKHLGANDHKRTALFELSASSGDGGAGALDGGPLAIKEWGEFPSAGDTAYAGMVMLDDHRALVSWYSGELYLDETWVLGMLDTTDIWTAVVDLSLLK